GLPISSASVVPMPEVNSSPRKLTAPQGLYETVSKDSRTIPLILLG
ncbi:MAG: transposase, partial [Paraburkholderia fungorum]